MFEDTLRNFVKETLGYVPTDAEITLFMSDLNEWYDSDPRDEEHKYSQKE